MAFKLPAQSKVTAGLKQKSQTGAPWFKNCTPTTVDGLRVMAEHRTDVGGLEVGKPSELAAYPRLAPIK